MREIEFRGKHTHTGEWRYGYLVYVPADNSYKITQGKELSYFVNTDTIGQYTGLKDRNGTKIFEGDIVIIDNYEQSLAVIEWDNNCANFYISDDNIYSTFDDYSINDLEVIGNIYDNPELLK